MTNLPSSLAAPDSLLCSPKAHAADGAPAETPAHKGPGTAAAPSLLENSKDVASAGSCGARGIIPVGQEPKRLYNVGEDRGAQRMGGREVASNRAARGAATDTDRSRRHKDINRTPPSEIRNPSGFYKYKNALHEKQVFVTETLRSLRRAESHVWLAIHNCQGPNGARISQARIMELAGIMSRKNVSAAVRSLQARGLLEVLVRGKYRPNGNGNHGLASVYRVHPRPEQRIIEAAQQKKQSRATKKTVKKKPR
jgi:hypothetical protein